MTAEIVLGNGFGIVVAADDATTSGNRRTYEGAKKIIGLPQPHSLAVLHAGNVLLHGVPFATFIDNWIETLPEKQLNSVADYMESFLDFTGDAVKDFASESEIAREYINQWQERLHNTYHRLKDNDQLSAVNLREYFEDLAQQWDSPLSNYEQDYCTRLYSLLGKDSKHNVLEDECRSTGCDSVQHSSIEGLLDLYFQDEADEAGMKFAYKWARSFLAKRHPSSSLSILTFVGYGLKEFLPVCDSHDVEGYIAGRLFHRDYRHRRAIRNEGGYTLFERFGQSMEIDRFIRESGLDPDFSAQIVAERVGRYESGLEESSDEIPEALDEDSNRNVSEIISPFEQIRSEIATGLTNAGDQNEGEARASLAGMNLQNCVSIAGRLIHLQNLAFDLRGELPTVGATVVVGILTKAHGFTFVDPETGESL